MQAAPVTKPPVESKIKRSTSGEEAKETEGAVERKRLIQMGKRWEV